MSKKQIKFLIPLGALLLTLVMLAGCRPSEALTRLMNAINALNPATEEMKTEEEQEEDKPDDNMDPIDEERDDAMLEETEELIGQMLDNMDEETADQALDAIYSATATSNEWGVQQYNPDRIIDAGSDSSALARYIRGNATSSVSGSASGSTDSLTDAAGTVKTDGVINSNGTPNESVDITRNDNDGGDDNGGGENPNGKPAVSDDGSDTGGDGDGDTGGDGGGDTGGDGGGDTGGDGGGDTGGDTGGDSNDGSGHYIAATGQAAIAVCMLGGSDRLVATSEDFYKNDLAQRAWNSDESMDYKVLWDGDGSTSLSPDKFQELLDLHPDLVVEVSGKNTITTEQYNSLQDAGIEYYAMYDMKSQSNINDGLRELGTHMDSSEGEGCTEAWDIANEYVIWATNAAAEAMRYSTNYVETVFIEDWDPEVVTRFNIKSYNSSTYQWDPTDDYVDVTQGAAVIRIGRSFRALTDYLVQANVYDWSASPHSRSGTRNQMSQDNYGYGDGYHDGSRGWNELKSTGTSIQATQPGEYCYVTPVYDRLDGTSNTSGAYQQGGLEFYNGRTGIGTIDDSQSRGDILSDTASSGLSYGNLCLGYSDSISTWNTVIVKNQYIKGELDSNPAWQRNGQTGTYYKSMSYLYTSVNYYCTPWDLGSNTVLSGMSYNTSIGGNYTSYVNPTGLGDWVEGSPESILESVWAAGYIQKGTYYTESYADSKIKEFYKTFYGLDLDQPENHDILDTILEGPAG